MLQSPGFAFLITIEKLTPMLNLAHLARLLLTIGTFACLLRPHLVMAGDGRDIALRGTDTAHACASCHGEAGEGIPANGYPRLSGMSAGYLVHQLDSFADGKRSKVVMTPIAKALTPGERRSVADYYSSQSSAKVYDQQSADEKLIARGKDIALRGDWSNALPGCSQCHGPLGEGVGNSFPALAAQNARYLASQLHRWKNGERSSDPNGLMTGIANKLDDADIAAVAAYYASLPVIKPNSGAGR
ncbi:MAG: c-type cytochrome [Hyphomicrobiales bacterium]|nr:c-type cytochrome [Hyphomicrobiales bacterium]